MNNKNNHSQTMSNFQTKFNYTVNEIYKDIQKFQNTKLSGLKSPKTEEFLDKIKIHISSGLYEIKSEMERLLNDLEWEEFNIAFFGETNSGKSTVIEALVSGNGKSIGDGRKDYTKKVSAIGYGSVNLLDMPGIEGNESKYQKEIEKAINKSHVIFYVIGTNKEPEEVTINKIKNYLRATVKIYSILNIRGKASVFKYKKELIGDNENNIINRIDSKFKSLFKNHYCGNIAINGHISFLCSFNSNSIISIVSKFIALINNIGNFIFKKILRFNRDFKLGRKFAYTKEKEDLIKIFGNIEKAY
ncbi:MAG: 50S ribosome-binding GTPase, partial [Ignavibacteria bacterium]|nr:50S ribosome-binding GTPase [Ignavibacteria bacterium]